MLLVGIPLEGILRPLPRPSDYFGLTTEGMFLSLGV
jgi:hypothetical protein